MHPCIAEQVNQILDGERPLPVWMTFGKAVLCQKDSAKGSAVDKVPQTNTLPALDVETNDWNVT